MISESNHSLLYFMFVSETSHYFFPITSFITYQCRVSPWGLLATRNDLGLNGNNGKLSTRSLTELLNEGGIEVHTWLKVSAELSLGTVFCYNISLAEWVSKCLSKMTRWTVWLRCHPLQRPWKYLDPRWRSRPGYILDCATSVCQQGRWGLLQWLNQCMSQTGSH